MKKKYLLILMCLGKNVFENTNDSFEHQDKQVVEYKTHLKGRILRV